MEPECRGCDLPSWLALAKFHGEIEGNSARAVEFLRAHGVLPRVVWCPRCLVQCHLRSDIPRWYCSSYTVERRTKKRRRCNYTVSDYKGSFLSYAHVEPWKVVVFVLQWFRRHWHYKEVIHNLHLSPETILAWHRHCCTVTDHVLELQRPVGGQGVVVEVGKVLIGAQQDRAGQVVGSVWAFGGVERECQSKLFVVPLGGCEEGKEEALTKLITKHVVPGSVVVSEELNAHLTLQHQGYTHLIVGHDNEGASEDHKPLHTHTIAALWCDLKQWVKKRGMRTQYFRQHLSRFLFLHHHQDQLLHRFFVEAARIFPPGAESAKVTT